MPRTAEGEYTLAMTPGEATFLIIVGGQLAFVITIVILDLITQRRDRRRASRYEKPM